MIFMQGETGGHINVCTHIRELCYTKGGKRGRVSKKCAPHRGGSGENEHGLPPFVPSSPLLNNDPSLSLLLGSLKRIIFIRTFLLVPIKGLCLKVFLVYSLLVV